MILLNYFPNDNNEIIRTTQYKAYPQCLPLLFAMAKEHYLNNQYAIGLRAAKLPKKQPKIIEKVRRMNAFEQQYLFGIYDLIAAIYRLQKGGGQLSLFNYTNVSKSYAAEWQSFYENEVAEICKDPIFCDHVIELTLLSYSDSRKRNLMSKIRNRICERHQVYYDGQHYMRKHGSNLVNELPEWVKF